MIIFGVSAFFIPPAFSIKHSCQPRFPARFGKKTCVGGR
nr:MAG TPA: hypothetical protein [Caudoviricetes sp.]